MTLIVKIEKMVYDAPLTVVSNPSIRNALRLASLAQSRTVIENLDFEIEPNKIVSIVGPSGSGKTTLLRILSGLEKRAVSNISLNAEKIIKPSRKVQVVFQNLSLFPWMNLRKNLEFAKCPARDGHSEEDVDKVLNKVGLQDVSNNFPTQISDGQKTRLNLARAFLCKPHMLLLDEPFRSLDQVTKEETQDVFCSFWKSMGRPITIIVSHNISDAIFLSDQVFLMSQKPLRLLEKFDTSAITDRRDTTILEIEKKIMERLRG